MEVININNKIYDFIKNKDFNNLLNFIKDNEELELDIPDENYNRLIDYLILYEKTDVIEYILKNNRIRLDILDRENKSILFKPIKYNRMNIIKLIIENDKTNIGVSIIDKKDNNGYNCLFYCSIFNNLEAFKYLYDNNADINCIDNNNNNLFNHLLKNEKNEMLIYVLEKELKNNNNILDTTKNKMNETLLQNSIIYDNNTITNYLLSKDLTSEYLNNQEEEYGLTILHNSIILKKNDITKKLIQKKIDINLQDYLGNSPLHYAIIENNTEIILLLLEEENINFNLINLDGNIPLFLYIQNYNINLDLLNDSNYESNIFYKLLKKTKYNLQNNNGESILYLIVKNNLWKNDKVKDILTNSNKYLNIFIKNNDGEIILDLVESPDRDNFINIIADSFYNKLVNTKKPLDIEWERYCSTNNLKDLSKLLKKKGDKGIEFYCKEKIKDVILNEKRSIPHFKKDELNIDSGIYQKGCYYTGSTVDILFGILFLYKTYPNIKLILEYPLTENNKLIDYYKKMGINYNYKLDFSNIEIIWIYQKLIYPVNFDSIFSNKIQNLNSENRFIVIPLGIETENGSHANILLIDTKNKIIERFEPNGYYSPRIFYFNSTLLDYLLETKFKDLIPEFKYIRPTEYLPIIGFQILESLETYKCKKIGDPNGFCAVWCIWWVFHKIQYENIKSKKLVKMLINKIKFNKLSFKNLIRNFSQKITKLRDEYFEKYNLDINKWMNDNYDESVLSNIEKDVLEFIR